MGILARLTSGEELHIRNPVLKRFPRLSLSQVALDPSISHPSHFLCADGFFYVSEDMVVYQSITSTLRPLPDMVFVQLDPIDWVFNVTYSPEN
jgi:hypothetical protein